MRAPLWVSIKRILKSLPRKNIVKDGADVDDFAEGVIGFSILRMGRPYSNFY